MPNANNLPSSERSGTRSGQSLLPKDHRGIETTGELRRFLSYIAGAVSRGEMKVPEAVVAVKACEQINASLYSEIKSAAIQAEAGKVAPPLGTLRIVDTE